MNADHIKNVLLAYYRYERQIQFVATECWDCDVVAYDPKSGILIEIEVKTSYDDYKAEFLKTKYKRVGGDHEAYCLHRLGSYFGLKRASPHLKYFAAPDPLAEKIITDLDSQSSPFGVITIPSRGLPSVSKRARKLVHGIMTEEGVKELVARMSSELITVRREARGGETDFIENFITCEEIFEDRTVWHVMDSRGRAMFSLHINLDEPDKMILSEVYVNPEYRKRGFGNYILDNAEARASLKNCSSIWLWAEKDRWMLKWYERHGYESMLDKDEGSIWMRKQISDLF